MVVTYCWAYNCTMDFCLREARVQEKNTTVDWFSFCREVCIVWLLRNPMTVGGYDANGQPETVEFDESYFLKLKHHRGLPGPQLWVFGGIERTSGNCFLVPVANRDANTLLALIRRLILPGTDIISDGWASYVNIPQILGETTLTELKTRPSPLWIPWTQCCGQGV